MTVVHARTLPDRPKLLAQTPQSVQLVGRVFRYIIRGALLSAKNTGGAFIQTGVICFLLTPRAGIPTAPSSCPGSAWGETSSPRCAGRAHARAWLAFCPSCARCSTWFALVSCLHEERKHFILYVEC